MDDDKLQQIRALLERDRATVEHQLADYGAPVDGLGLGVSMDEGFADTAQVTAERGEALTLIRQQQALHEAILAALSRLDEGTYGQCESCGGPIPIERLEAVPTASLCVTCKQTRRGLGRTTAP